ncbi:MAG: hypothetical protein IT497_03525 [Ottowia sp.]|nr:hypothetical protein [Ottowia sp.]
MLRLTWLKNLCVWVLGFLSMLTHADFAQDLIIKFPGISDVNERVELQLVVLSQS